MNDRTATECSLMSEWQPIETAPKDGTKVILCEADQPSDVCMGWFMEGEWRDYGDLGCNGMCNYEPTHWMPLPIVPEGLK